jgi:catechol 2,3-dioxygenase-like lactoylglutathione lyase family enzyme
MISLLANIDVPDLAAAIEFYREALGLHLGRARILLGSFCRARLR